MSKEELLKVLRDAGMDDGAIEAMLEEIIAELHPEGEAEAMPADEDAKKAGELLGVDL